MTSLPAQKACAVFCLLRFPHFLIICWVQACLDFTVYKVYNRENERNDFVSIVLDPSTSLEPEIRGLNTCLFPFRFQNINKVGII